MSSDNAEPPAVEHYRVTDLPDGPVREAVCGKCGRTFRAPVKLHHDAVLVRCLCDACLRDHRGA